LRPQERDPARYSRYGWRKSEMLGLRVKQVDLRNGTIRLNPGTTKNKAGREVTCTEKVAELLRECIAGKSKDDYVLTRASGKRIKEFRGAWRALFAAAGVEERLPHDLRRSAAKALRRAGVPETVIMSMGGWKTRKVFERFAIVSASDQREAVKLLQVAREASRVLGPVLVPNLKRQTRK
jgi:integrase